jgi:hypothetical protein
MLYNVNIKIKGHMNLLTHRKDDYNKSMSFPTNSLQSNMMHAAVKGAPAPTVGMGVTILYWTDRHVGTIVKVISHSEIHFTSDDTVADPSKPLAMGHQEWIHTPNPNGPIVIGKKAKDGKWYIAHKTPTGQMRVNKHCTPLAVGVKNYRYDWSF